MGQKKMLVVIMAAAISCLAKSAPFAVQRLAVDKLFKIAVVESPSQVALVALEQVAGGHPEAVEAQLAASAGIKQQDAIELSWFREPEVRAHAMRRIGDTGRQEAIRFLSALRAVEFDSDETSQIWPQSQVALQQALLLNIDNRLQRIEFLENLVRTTRGSVGSWAIDQLCSLGSLPSSPLIAAAIREMNSGQRAEDAIRFAEARIRVVTSDPDRLKALSSALEISSDPDKFRMIQWAIEELASMRTANADAALDRYSATVSALPEKSAERATLLSVPDDIRYFRQR